MRKRSARSASLLSSRQEQITNNVYRQQLLEKLVLCSVERDLVQQADVEKIVDRFFALTDNRRVVLS